MLKFKQLIFIFLLSFISFNFCFAKEANKNLVIYYSRTGNTKLVAEKISEKFNADIERLIDQRKRTGPIGYARASKDAVYKNLTDLEPIDVNPEQYQLIIIGTPSWYGNMTPAVRTFLSEYDLSDKSVAVFGTAHLTGVENACKQIAEAIKGEDYKSVPVLALREAELEAEVLAEKIDEFYKDVAGKGE